MVRDRADPTDCPFCAAGPEYQERRGPQMFWNVCARCWYPETKHDRAVTGVLSVFGKISEPLADRDGDGSEDPKVPPGH